MNPKMINFFSENFLFAPIEQLRDELNNIADVKADLLAKERYFEIARVRDWEKKVIEAIELKLKQASKNQIS